MMGMMRDMLAMMQQTQQQLLLQQQYALAPLGGPVMPQRDVHKGRDRERAIKFPEFIRMVLEFHDLHDDPTYAE